MWDTDERFTIWGQKVKGQGHDGTKYAGAGLVNTMSWKILVGFSPNLH